MMLSELFKSINTNDYIVEAVNINKDYLQKLSIQNELDFKEAKNITNLFMNELQYGVSISPSVKDKFANLLTCINIKSKLSFINDELLYKLHDGIMTNNNLLSIILQKTNSDTEPEQFNNIIDELVHKAKSSYSLSTKDLIIWERVKVYKDFGNYRWVYAVDENGNISEYMPSRITAVTMNHCGNEPSARDGDEYWELRDESNHAYLTVILNNGLIQEAKSYGNETSRYVNEIYKYVEWFYKSDIVKGVGHRYDYGYGTDKNFGVFTIASVDPEFLNWCKTHKPALLGKTERAVIKYKKYDVNELTNMYLNNPNMFGKNHWAVYLMSIGGKENLPLTEDDIIYKLIKPHKLTLEVFSNADIELLTEKIQRAYIKFYVSKSLKTLIEITKQVNSFNIAYSIVQFLYAKNKVKTYLLLMSLPERKLKFYKDFLH